MLQAWIEAASSATGFKLIAQLMLHDTYLRFRIYFKNCKTKAK